MAALTTCPDCKASVSKKAAACPQCGRPLKAKSSGCSGVGCLFILALVGGIAYLGSIGEITTNSNGSNEPRPTPRVSTKYPIGTAPVPRAWNGSFREVTTFLSVTLNDPDSVEYIAWFGPHESPKGWIVGCRYRAKNAFGAFVLKDAEFTILNGAVIDYREGNFR